MLWHKGQICSGLPTENPQRTKLLWEPHGPACKGPTRNTAYNKPRPTQREPTQACWADFLISKLEHVIMRRFQFVKIPHHLSHCRPLHTTNRADWRLSPVVLVLLCISECVGMYCCVSVDSLHSFAPCWRITHRHEHTVGQNGHHDEQTE